MTHETTRYRSIWLSDVHLGTAGCKADALLAFLKTTESDYLYLVGDIFDGWRIKQSFWWAQSHTNVVHKLLGKAKKGTQLIYIPGNHDEFVRLYTDFSAGNIQVVNQATHETLKGTRLLVLHGDEFDSLIRSHRWLGLLGTRVLAWVQILSEANSALRRRLGLPGWSLADYIKLRAKGSAAALARFEKSAVAEACERGFDGVVCGHVHIPAAKWVDGLMYYNDGDWVEHTSALVEDYEGNVHLIDFKYV